MNSQNKTDSNAPDSATAGAVSSTADALDPMHQPPNPIPGQSSLNIRVRYCECDPMGVAHHASYLPWMELGRTELLRDIGQTYKLLEAQSVFLVITKLDVQYRRPIRYDDIVEIRTRIVGRSRVKLQHEYEFVLAERDGSKPDIASDPSIPADGILSTASTVLACVDDNGKVQALPEWLQGR